MNAIILYRLGHAFHKRKMYFVAKTLQNINFLIFNSYIPSSAKIGKGTRFAYGGIGVVIHKDALIGSDCILGQGITIGASEGYASNSSNKAPIIGDNCYVSAGSKIIGDVKIGSNSIIGASSLVNKSFPNNSVVVGIPARLIKKTAVDYKAIEKNNEDK
ncbi:serine O-acetyltransferase [Vibrio lentus]|uniref:serine O-acetyltransferase n=1 Tax=Vibrio lentus TaxID=136468 RepID=UPI000C82D841|nr:serine acetyltransferase [Vibrio lentus]PMI85451.1 serine acetyltransferase [Vibrio lentus]